jgi:putative flippase GtrA
MRVFFKYFTSGIVATVSHFIILIILVEIFYTDPLIASISGFIVTIFVNYLFQYHWTFRCSGPYTLIFVRYLTVTLLMLVLNTVLFWIISKNFSIPYTVVQAIVTFVVFLCNFTINKRYTFVYSDSN